MLNHTTHNRGNNMSNLNHATRIKDRHVRWASQHDWFIHATVHGGCNVIHVRDFVPNDATGEYDETVRKFGCLDQLRAWAGY